MKTSMIPVAKVLVTDDKCRRGGEVYSLCACTRHCLVALLKQFDNHIDIFTVSTTLHLLTSLRAVDGPGTAAFHFGLAKSRPCFVKDTTDPIIIVPDCVTHVIHFIHIPTERCVGSLPHPWPAEVASWGDRRVAVLNDWIITVFQHEEGGFTNWTAIKYVQQQPYFGGLSSVEWWVLDLEAQNELHRPFGQGSKMSALSFYPFVQSFHDGSSIKKYEECGTKGYFFTQNPSYDGTIWMIDKSSSDVDEAAVVRSALRLPCPKPWVTKGFCMYGSYGIITVHRMFDHTHQDVGLILEMLMTPDDFKMVGISIARIAWMGAVARSVFCVHGFDWC